MLAICSYSQKRIDRVTLKDKSVISGKIIERTDSVSVKIKTDETNVVVIPWKEIEFISAQEIENTDWLKEKKRNRKLADALAKGFTGYFSYPGYQYLDGSMMTVYLGLGYQFNPHFAIMGGSGVEVFHGLTVPFFADIHVNILPQRMTPFIFLRGGYALHYAYAERTNKNNYKATSARPEGTPYVNPGIGYRFKFLPHFGVSVKLGYRLNYVTGLVEKEFNNYGYTYTKFVEGKRLFHGFNVSVGMDF